MSPNKSQIQGQYHHVGGDWAPNCGSRAADLALFPFTALPSNQASKAAALAGFSSSKFSNQTQKLSSQTTSQNLSNQQAVTQNSTPYINGSQLIPQLCLVVFRLLIAWWNYIDTHTHYIVQRYFIWGNFWHPRRLSRTNKIYFLWHISASPGM